MTSPGSCATPTCDGPTGWPMRPGLSWNSICSDGHPQGGIGQMQHPPSRAFEEAIIGGSNRHRSRRPAGCWKTSAGAWRAIIRSSIATAVPSRPKHARASSRQPAHHPFQRSAPGKPAPTRGEEHPGGAEKEGAAQGHGQRLPLQALYPFQQPHAHDDVTQV